MPPEGTTLEQVTAMIQYAPVALLVLDRNRCLLKVNKMAEAMLALDPNQSHGQPFARWVAADSYGLVTKKLNYAADSKWSTDLGRGWAQVSRRRLVAHSEI